MALPGDKILSRLSWDTGPLNLDEMENKKLPRIHILDSG